MPFIKCYDMHEDLRFQCEVEKETVEKAKVLVGAFVQDKPWENLPILPRSNYDRGKILAALNPLYVYYTETC